MSSRALLLLPLLLVVAVSASVVYSNVYTPCMLFSVDFYPFDIYAREDSEVSKFQPNSSCFSHVLNLSNSST